MTEWEEYLSTIYYDPAHPASFAGPNKLFQEVKNEGRFNISLNRIRKWLQNQEVYSIHRPLRRKFARNRVIVNGIDD